MISRTASTAVLLLAALSWLPSLASNGLHFERVGTESGFSPEVITEVYQDRQGFIWFGTRDGLFLYDGHTLRVFEHDASDPDSIADHSVRTIYEDRAGNLWVGTNTGGLDRLDRATWTFEHFRHDSADPSSLSHDSVYAIVQDHDGALWVGTQRGLNRLDMGTGSFDRFLADFTDPASLSNDYIMDVHADRTGRLWVATLGGGLNLWDHDEREFTVFRHDPDDLRSLIYDSISTIVEDPSGDLWIGSLEGLVRMDTESGTFHRYAYDPEDPDGLSDPLVTSLALGPAGKLWIGTHGGGLNQLDIETGKFRVWRHRVEQRNSLGDDDILRLLTDDTGSLWVGTWGGGLNRLTPTSLLLASSAPETRMPEDTDDNDVTALMYDARGSMWIGTRTGDVIRNDSAGGEVRRYLRGGSDGVPRIILAFTEDRNGHLWVGTNGGIIRIDVATAETLEWFHDPDDPHSLGPGYAKAVLVDRLGRLWVGTGEGGLNLLDLDGRVLDRFLHDATDPGSLSDDYVTALHEDRHGTLWVGTRSGGLNAFDPETGNAIQYLPDPTNDRSISHHYVTSILEDSSGRLWIGTSGGGINRVDRNGEGVLEFTRITEREGLIDNDVMGVLQDDDGSLWLSTKRGLSRFDSDSDSFASVVVSDGLPTAEFESGAAARSNHSLCFGSVKGPVAIPAGSPFPPPEPSPMVVSSIRTSSGEIRGDRPVWELETMDVPYGEWLSIELAVLDYSPERRHRYAYRLDDALVDLGPRREITFTDLKPGEHLFSAMGRNSQGVWSAETVPLRIAVIPPFWMKPWFRLLMLLAVVAGALLIHWRRTSVLEKRNRELLELHRQREKAQSALARAYDRLRFLTRRLEAVKEDERKHIARELHDDMGPALTAVIINLQLLTSSPERSAQRIADTVDLVDRLVQRVRDISLDLRPPLLDELGLLPALKGYLEAQAERTGIVIDVSGDSVEGLQAEVEITAFRVVQESVTNVIRHANASRVDVAMRLTPGELNLLIVDDGGGFDVRDTMEGAAGKALGLLGMQERVRALGGELEIDSAPGRGTTVRARVPTEIGP